MCCLLLLLLLFAGTAAENSGVVSDVKKWCEGAGGVGRGVDGGEGGGGVTLRECSLGWWCMAQVLHMFGERVRQYHF